MNILDPLKLYGIELARLMEATGFTVEGLEEACGNVKGTSKDSLKRARAGKAPLSARAQKAVVDCFQSKNLPYHEIDVFSDRWRNAHLYYVTSPRDRAALLKSWVALDFATKGQRQTWLRFMDPVVEQLQLFDKTLTSGRSPDTRYATRLAYIGCIGAKNWLDLEKHEAYMTHRRRTDIAKSLGLLLERHSAIRTFVSLGCGNGKVDKEILEKVYHGNSADISYVPLDISHALLTEAHAALEHSFSVPFDILADFEQDPLFVRQCLDRVRRPACFALLGNTLENLVGGETDFLEFVSSILKPGDVFLLHVRTQAEGYSVQNDPWYNVSSYYEEQRQFLELPLERLLGHRMWRPDQDGAEEKRPLEELLEVRIVPPDSHMASRVPNTVTFELFCKELQAPVLRVDRYTEPGLISYFQSIGLAADLGGAVKVDNVPLQDSLFAARRTKDDRQPQ